MTIQGVPREGRRAERRRERAGSVIVADDIGRTAYRLTGSSSSRSIEPGATGSRRLIGGLRRPPAHLLDEHVVQRRLATLDRVGEEVPRPGRRLALAPALAPGEQQPDPRAVRGVLEGEGRHAP